MITSVPFKTSPATAKPGKVGPSGSGHSPSTIDSAPHVKHVVGKPQLYDSFRPAKAGQLPTPNVSSPLKSHSDNVRSHPMPQISNLKAPSPQADEPGCNFKMLEDLYVQNLQTLRRLQELKTVGNNENETISEIRSMTASNAQSIGMICQGLQGINELLEKERQNPQPNTYLRYASPSVERPLGGQPPIHPLPPPATLPVQKPPPIPTAAPGTQVATLELLEGTRKRNVPCYCIRPDPDVFEWRGLLTREECDNVIRMCEGRWRPSRTSKGLLNSDPANYVGGISENRTSYSVVLQKSETPFLAKLEKRVAAAAQLNVSHLEGLAVVRYHPGQYFNEHHDGDFRCKTLLLYLSDEVEGGATVFSRIGVSIQPKAGNGVLWSNILPDGTADWRTLHAGVAPRKGVKYAVNCFFNKKPIVIPTE